MKEGELSIPPAQSSHVRPGTATPPQGPSLPGLTHPRATRGLRRPVAAVPEEGGREQRQVSGQQAHGAAAGPVFRDGGSPGRRCKTMQGEKVGVSRTLWHGESAQ